MPIEYRYNSDQPNSVIFLRGLDYKIELVFKLESLKNRYVIFKCTVLLCKKNIAPQISDSSFH